jgi:hypothetical protein
MQVGNGDGGEIAEAIRRNVQVFRTTSVQRFPPAAALAGQGKGVDGLLIPMGIHECSPENLRRHARHEMRDAPVRKTNRGQCR